MKVKFNNRRGNGQTLVIVAFSIMTLIAFVGLGVDLGLTYVEKVRVQRAVDAAALAAAAELPVEAAAQLRALEYLSENDYDCNIVTSSSNANCTDPNVHVKINAAENFPFDPDNPTDTKIEISTNMPDFDSRIRVQVTQQVQLYFMRLLGFNQVSVTGVATAENIKNLDVVLVFDKSGSMEFDTLCYGCWTPKSGAEYPEGGRWQLRWDGPPYGPPAHCAGPAPTPDNQGYYYIAIAAEEYSSLSNDYHRDTRPGQGYTYWVMQRNGKITVPGANYLGNTAAFGRDIQGAYIAHFPKDIGYNRDSGSAGGVPCIWDDVNNGYICRRGDWISERGGPYPAPRVDYGFTPPEGGNNWYIWIRAQGGSGSQDPLSGQGVFWGLSGAGYNDLEIKGRGAMNQHDNDGAATNRRHWTWRRLLIGEDDTGGSRITFTPGQEYTLHFWAGSAGFVIDRIIITNDSGDLPEPVTQPSFDLDNNRTNWACDPCDARFGGHPDGLGNTSEDGDDPPKCDAISGPNLNPDARRRYEDDLFDDEQPMAGTSAAAVRFVRKLDFNFDQIGLVRYSSRAENKPIELLCLKSHGTECVENLIDEKIVDPLLTTRAGGSTNIADGLEEAIKMMDNSSPHYGRPSAAHVIILMTDGQPNQYSGLDDENKTACYADDLWPGTSKAHDCALYFAYKARNEGIIIYGITLGEGADKELIQAISETTGGIHLHAEDSSRLDDIFDELYNRIFLRLVE